MTLGKSLRCWPSVDSSLLWKCCNVLDVVAKTIRGRLFLGHSEQDLGQGKAILRPLCPGKGNGPLWPWVASPSYSLTSSCLGNSCHQSFLCFCMFQASICVCKESRQCGHHPRSHPGRAQGTTEEGPGRVSTDPQCSRFGLCSNALTCVKLAVFCRRNWSSMNLRNLLKVTQKRIVSP